MAAVADHLDALRGAQALRILTTLDSEASSFELARSDGRWVVVVEAAATGAVETFRGSDVQDALAQAAQWLNLEALRERPAPYELEPALESTRFQGACSSCDGLVPCGATSCPHCGSKAAIILLEVNP